MLIGSALQIRVLSERTQLRMLELRLHCLAPCPRRLAVSGAEDTAHVMEQTSRVAAVRSRTGMYYQHHRHRHALRRRPFSANQALEIGSPLHRKCSKKPKRRVQPRSRQSARFEGSTVGKPTGWFGEWEDVARWRKQQD